MNRSKSLTVSRTIKRVQVVIGPDEHRVNDEALAGLRRHPNVFSRGGLLVTVVRAGEPPGRSVRPQGAHAIKVIPAARLREMLSACVDFQKYTGGDEPSLVQTTPPASCYRALLARGSWAGIRTLEGITECPVLLPNGSVLQEPGYHRGSGLLYLPNRRYPPIREAPSAAQVREAVKLLEEVVCDFPFAGEHHRAAWVASSLTILARHAFFGPSPCMVITSNTRGCGKGLLADTACQIATGRTVARMAYTRNCEEQRKEILAIAMAGDPVVLIDNVDGAFGSSVLDAALTATEYSGRYLGQSRMVTAPLNVVWFVTGNNVVPVGDTVRRCLSIRLESPLEHPERRREFRHPRLSQWVWENRARLVCAVLTVLRAYVKAGRPDLGLSPWGSFEGWSDLIRNCVVWAGLPDPGETRQELYDTAESEGAVLRQLVSGLREVLEELEGGCGTAAEILAVLRRSPDRFQQLREALSELVLRPQDGSLPSTPQMGTLLRQYRGRNLGGLKVDHAQKLKTNAGRLWCVQPVPGASTGAGGAGSDGVLPPFEQPSRPEAESLVRGGPEEEDPESPSPPAPPAPPPLPEELNSPSPPSPPAPEEDDREEWRF